MAFVSRSTRTLGASNSATGKNVGPGAYININDNLGSAQKKISTKQPFQQMVDRSGKNQGSYADRQNENRSYLGKLPYYDEVMVDKQNLQN